MKYGSTDDLGRTFSRIGIVLTEDVYALYTPAKIKPVTIVAPKVTPTPRTSDKAKLRLNELSA